MLLAGFTENKHFSWKVAYVDYQSVTSTVSVCSSVGLTENAIRNLGGPVESVLRQNAQFMTSQVAACWDAAGEVRRLPLSYFRTPR